MLVDDPMVASECNPCDEEVLLQEGWDKEPCWERLVAHRQAQLFLSVYADDKQMVGRKSTLASVWKNVEKD